MKTSAALLQEVMVKLGKVPEYECIAQTGPPHQAKFEYRCKAHGLTASATAHSKKDAKQAAACNMLSMLADRGVAIPSTAHKVAAVSYGDEQSEYHFLVANVDSGTTPVGASAASATPSYVSLLNEFSTEHRLPAPHYELCAVRGPPHQPHFTVRASLASHHRSATSTTKKSARQLAAQQLYIYLKENLAEAKSQAVQWPMSDSHGQPGRDDAHGQPGRDDEHGQHGQPGRGDALVERCLQSLRGRKPESAVERNSLPALVYIDAARRPAVRAALEAHRGQAPERVLEAVVAALGLRVVRHALPAEHGSLVVLELSPGAPPLAMAALDLPAASAATLRCLCRALTCH